MVVSESVLYLKVGVPVPLGIQGTCLILSLFRVFFVSSKQKIVFLEQNCAFQGLLSTIVSFIK